MEIRNKQFQESKNFQDKGEDDDDDEEEEEDEYSLGVANGASDSKEPTARQSMKAGGAMIFARNQDEKLTVKLQDFIIMKMVGKGTFGKVYLV